MKNIIIYFGPKIGFNKILNYDETYITLTNLALLSDKNMREHSFKLPNRKRFDEKDGSYEETPKIVVPNLYAFSDEYSALNENAIQGFLSFLSQFEIESLYLQNPPSYIVSQLYKIGIEPKVFKYVYNTVTFDTLKQINSEFSSNIIGQENVKKKLITTLYSLNNKNFKKPIVMLLYGPTGVGKTETAKFLSKVLKQQLFRKQFSMFNSEEFASFLFGGKHYQNSLSREFLERESNIILFDEFDKTNPVLYSAFYQLFDEGIYEDKNYTVLLNKAIIICTSNYSSLDEIRQKLGDPIYSRFNAIIKYDKLNYDTVCKIIKKIFYEKYNLLEDWEKEQINPEILLPIIISDSDNIENSRQIQNVINDKINEILVEYVLNN